MTTKAIETVQRELYETELQEIQVSEKRNVGLLKLGFVLTFLLYLIFNQHLYLGDATGWGEYLKDGASMSGFVFLMTITVLMALFLAGVKHHLYLHFGVAGQVLYVVVLLIGFALLAEMFSTSASQDVKSRIMLSKDEAYQQTLKNSSTPATLGSSELTTDLATARRKLAQCRERLKQGREPHCKGSAATLHSLMESERKLMSAQKQISVEGQKLNYDRQDKLKADSYNPVVVSTAKLLAWFAGSGHYGEYVKQAIMMLMMIVAITFEVLHHFLSKVSGENKRKEKALLLQLAAMDDRQQQDNSLVEVKQENKQPFGFNQPVGTATTIAQWSKFKYQDKQPANEPESKTKQPFGFAPSPKAERPAKTVPGGTDKHNPVLGMSEQHYELPLDKPMPETVSRPLANGAKTGSQVSDSGEQQSNPKSDSGGDPATVSKPLANGTRPSLYERWVSAVQKGDCKPSVKPTWSWIQKRIAGSETGKRTPDRTKITLMQKGFFSRAIVDGHMILNPKYKNGGKKYLWQTQTRGA